MGLTAELGHRAGIEILNVAGLELVRSSDALALLDEIERAGVLVLGIEGFAIQGYTVVPDMNLIADYSDRAKTDQSSASALSDARCFFQNIEGEDRVFEIICA